MVEHWPGLLEDPGFDTRLGVCQGWDFLFSSYVQKPKPTCAGNGILQHRGPQYLNLNIYIYISDKLSQYLQSTTIGFLLSQSSGGFKEFEGEFPFMSAS